MFFSTLLNQTEYVTHTHTHTFTRVNSHIYMYANTHIYIHINMEEIMELEMDTVTRVQILDEADCISRSSNIHGKGMNRIILPPAMGKW